MPRSHHRKKHKSHVRQFKQAHDTGTGDTRRKGKVTAAFTILGALTGGAICYFASSGDIMVIGIGVLIGAVVGYYAGHRIDSVNL
jgi:hypothetical protein